MKVLLDTNIIIHRETNNVVIQEIGILFKWLDNLHYSKVIHPLTIDEVSKYGDQQVVSSFKIKMDQYNVMKTQAPMSPEMLDIEKEFDKDENDKNDSILLNELFNNRVNYLITEDKKIHKKALRLGIANKVFRIESFLEKVSAENPGLLDYKTLLVKKENFGKLNLKDSFFDSFRKDYQGFDEWFNSKSENEAYVCYNNNEITAFLFLKNENENEAYNDITPLFPKKKRLKIGTFKVVLNGYKLGERFLKIIFDNAITQKVDEIYVTIFNNTPEQERLVDLLLDWGFLLWGEKNSKSGKEIVLTRNFTKRVDLESPKSTFPYLSMNSNVFIVPIYPDYHTSLFPDSILRGESPNDFTEHEPFRNALSKVYVSRSINRDLKSGDIIIFYRTGGLYHSVITTIGIVESVIDNFKTEDEFIEACRKRSVFSEKELSAHWNYKKFQKPFIVNFLYAYSFPHRINMAKLIELGIIKDVNSAPRGFEQIKNEHFEIILNETKTNESIIVN